MTTGDNYSIVTRANWMQTIQMHLSQTQKIFSKFFTDFFEFALNFEYFRKKMSLIAYVYPKLPTTKDELR